MRTLRSLLFVPAMLCSSLATADTVVCVKIANKSCDYFYGAWPGPAPGAPNDCKFLPCANAYNCTNGEVAVLYWNRTQDFWNDPTEVHIPPGEGEPGNLMTQKYSVGVCKYMDVCDYACVVNPIGGNRCKTMYRTDWNLWKWQVNVGECTGF